MKLSRSAWKRCLGQNLHYDYILIIPEESVILSFTSLQEEDDRRVIWGCWIRDESDSIVYTAVKNANDWRKESYKIEDDQLIWDNCNGTGSHVWTKIDEEDIPEVLRLRGSCYLEDFKQHQAPEY